MFELYSELKFLQVCVPQLSELSINTQIHNKICQIPLISDSCWWFENWWDWMDGAIGKHISCKFDQSLLGRSLLYWMHIHYDLMKTVSNKDYIVFFSCLRASEHNNDTRGPGCQTSKGMFNAVDISQFQSFQNEFDNYHASSKFLKDNKAELWDGHSHF